MYGTVQYYQSVGCGGNPSEITLILPLVLVPLPILFYRNPGRVGLAESAGLVGVSERKRERESVCVLVAPRHLLVGPDSLASPPRDLAQVLRKLDPGRNSIVKPLVVRTVGLVR